MQISELLAQKRSIDIKHIQPDATLCEMAAMLTRHDIGVLLVLDACGAVTGIASERDLARDIARHGSGVAGRSVGDIMTSPVVTCSLNDAVADTMLMMNEKNIRHIPVMDRGRPVAVVSIREFNLAFQKLQAEARTDHLTGLPNRRNFMEVLEQEMSLHRRFDFPLSVAMLDLDRFKRVNDTFGHDAGDRVIRRLAKLFKNQFRCYDHVGRLGGEEFGIIFPHTRLMDAERACVRLSQSIKAERISADTGSIVFTASIGLVEADVPGECALSILKRADTMLYHAKETGRDRIVTELEDGLSEDASAA